MLIDERYTAWTSAASMVERYFVTACRGGVSSVVGYSIHLLHSIGRLEREVEDAPKQQPPRLSSGRIAALSSMAFMLEEILKDVVSLL
jgi:hypothetical protein